MLKKPASFVLGSSKSSTYPRGYVSGFDSPAALLNGLFEHPAFFKFMSATLQPQGEDFQNENRKFRSGCEYASRSQA